MCFGFPLSLLPDGFGGGGVLGRKWHYGKRVQCSAAEPPCACGWNSVGVSKSERGGGEVIKFFTRPFAHGLAPGGGGGGGGAPI